MRLQNPVPVVQMLSALHLLPPGYVHRKPIPRRLRCSPPKCLAPQSRPAPLRRLRVLRETYQAMPQLPTYPRVSRARPPQKLFTRAKTVPGSGMGANMLLHRVSGWLAFTNIFRSHAAQDRRGIRFGGFSLRLQFTGQRQRQANGQCLCHTPHCNTTGQ